MTRGPVATASTRSAVTCWVRRRRYRTPTSSAERVAATSASTTRAASGSQGASCGAPAWTISVSRSPASAGGASESIPSRWRTSRRAVRKGDVRAKGSPATVTQLRSPASRRTSDTRRDFPVPCSPVISTTWPWPWRTPSRAPVRISISRSRPTRGP